MRKRFITALLAAPVLAIGLMAAVNVPDPPKANAPESQGKAAAVLAGGCFWGMQGIFEHMKGVTETVVGYAGGKANTAKYEIIEEGDTGHAESIKVTYDPSQISYGELLKVYFSVAHDPTTLNRQHNDVGTQYRSSIFYADQAQKAIAEQYIQDLNSARVFKNKIVTKVVPLEGFYKAEDYHQHYLDQVVSCDGKSTFHCGELNQGYIRGIDIPLLKDFQQKYPDLYVKEIH